MHRILCIGNSFSQDATAYLYDMAKQGGTDVKTVNLYIGGCPLKTHWENAENNHALYQYELNGKGMGKMVSIREALLEDYWDIVTMQQASHDSGLEETYYPYLTSLSEYVKKYAPGPEQMIHKTWAYEQGSLHSAFPRYQCDPEVMYRALSAAYQKASEAIHARLIPSGDIVRRLTGRKEFDAFRGGQSLYRDAFHMHLIYGRYALAAVWYEFVLRGNVLANSFVPPSDKLVDQGLLKLIAQTVHEMITG